MSGSIKRPTFQHVIIEGINTSGKINSLNWISGKTELLIKELNIEVKESLQYQFPPKGVTIVFILSSSHLIIHTWPESSYFHIRQKQVLYNTALLRIYTSSELFPPTSSGSQNKLILKKSTRNIYDYKKGSHAKRYSFSPK